MALSGTLDTFALPDVLRLLASTAKTGRLRITGDRGSGNVWVDAGKVVATELASAVTQEPTNAEVVFGLLRFGAGSFTFEADALAANAAEPESLEPVLAAAENMLVEWRAIEKVIPSLDVWVGLRPELDGPDVMVDRHRWRGIAAIGAASQVGAVAESLNLNEIESCRLVKELLELGLVDFVDEPSGVRAAGRFEPESIEEGDFDDHGIEPAAEMDAPAFADVTPGKPEALLRELDAMDDAPTFGADRYDEDAPFDVYQDDVDQDDVDQDDVDQDDVDQDDVDQDDVDQDDVDQDDQGELRHDVEPSLAALGSTDGSIDPLLSAGDLLDAMSAPLGGNNHASADTDVSADMFGRGTAPVDGDDELDPAEMARQLANLSPKAAKAVAAAARATTDAERDAALAAVEAEDDSVNRGLLLKFLGSVDS